MVAGLTETNFGKPADFWLAGNVWKAADVT
jgi:hypothetical protein